MTERLGEMLLHGGALTEAQLEEVLSAQSIYGGRLGTNLVEMGLLSEDDLAQLLNQKLGVPSVNPTSLEVVPAQLIALLPQEMAQRFQVLPVALDGKRLTLAMADPSNYSAIDEIGFFTGLVIVPRVCSELRLALALERYYGIKRVLHFIPVAGGMRTRMINATRNNAGLGPAGKTPCPGDGFGGGGAPQAIFAGNEVNVVGSPGCGVSSDAPGVSLDAISRCLAAASGETEVVSILMSYLKENFDRACVLCLKRGSAIGVQAAAFGAVIASFAGWAVELEGALQLNRVLQERSPFLGKLSESGAEGQILAKIGALPGDDVLLQPLVIGGASVAFILVADDSGRLGSGMLNLQRVVTKAGLAFEMLGIRKKIGLV